MSLKVDLAINLHKDFIEQVLKYVSHEYITFLGYRCNVFKVSSNLQLVFFFIGLQLTILPIKRIC